MIGVLIILYILITSTYWCDGVPVRNSKNLPHAIIIGVKKCGTRALLKFLSMHSSVVAASTEIHFFDSMINFQRGLHWYKNEMPMTEKNQSITIEKTPHYFIDKRVPKRIAHLLPNIKLIIILRNPIVRAVSDYMQIKARHNFYPTFDEFVSYSNFTRWTPIKIGCYGIHLRRWLKHFSLEQIHFVNGENLIRRPWEELRYVQQFLNLSIEIRQEDFYFNSNKFGFPCVRRSNGCLGSSKGRQHPVILNRTRDKLKDFYSTCNAQIKQLVHIDFSWLLQ